MANLILSLGTIDGRYDSNISHIHVDSDVTQARENLLRYKDVNGNIENEFIEYMAPFGILMNVIFLYVVVRIRSMHTIINVYLANLAVADATVLMIVLTALIWQERGLVANVTLGSTIISANYASYFIVTALAFERFFAVCNPLEFRAEASKVRAAKILAVLWTIAIVTGTGDHCTVQWGGNVGRSIAGVLFLLFHIIGLLIDAYLYTCVVKKLRQQPPITSADHHQQRLRRVVAMLIVNTTVFFILGTMYIIKGIFAFVILWSSLSELNNIKALNTFLYIDLVTSFFTILNNSVDPLVYGGVNPDYRAAFMEAFSFLNPQRCCCCCHGYRCQPSQDTPQEPAEQIELQEIHQEPTPQSHPQVPECPTK